MVSTESLAHPLRTIFTDDRFFEEVSELTGITFGALHRAFVGKEKNLALDVMKTAVAENPQGTPEEWQRWVLAWAKDNGSGEYRPQRRLTPLKSFRSTALRLSHLARTFSG